MKDFIKTSISLVRLKNYAESNNWLELICETYSISNDRFTVLTYQVQDHIYKYTFKENTLLEVKEVEVE